MQQNEVRYCKADWPAPSNVHALTTFRMGGYSVGPYDSFNLSTMVGDEETCVIKNRQQLKTQFCFQHEPIWMKQTHGINVICADEVIDTFPEADAAWTTTENTVCAILTADCLPILLAHQNGMQVAAIHAGWRGLAAGIIESTCSFLKGARKDWLAWLGPAIGPAGFEVEDRVRMVFLQHHPDAHVAFRFIPSYEKNIPRTQKWSANIYVLAKQRLQQQGIHQIYGGTHCTWSDKTHFYSYRRDDERTGRMASLIWIQSG